jgi:hypothetical protein
VFPDYQGQSQQALISEAESFIFSFVHSGQTKWTRIAQRLADKSFGRIVKNSIEIFLYSQRN